MRVQPVDVAAGRRITRSCGSRRAAVAFAVDRHRHRHRAGEAAADLRGVPAGRRRHQPQVRRHRPRPGHQPRAGDAARRRDPAGQRRRARAARSRCTCRSTTPGPARAVTAPATDADGRRARQLSLPVLAVAKAEEVVADDRDDDRRGRHRPADRRRRSALRAHPARAGARQGVQGHRRQPRRSRRCRWRASTCRRRSRSTSSCPTCSAGRCSTTSSSIRRRGTSRCRCCRSRKSASTASRTARSRTWSSRRRPTSSSARSTASRRYVAPHTKRLLVVEDNDIERAEHRRAARPRRHRDRRRSAPAPRRCERCASSAVRLLRRRPAPARHDRLRAARDACRPSRRCATCRSSSSPARS